MKRVMLGQVGFVDGHWQITATGSCGHKNSTCEDVEPEPEELEPILIALGREPCAKCRSKTSRQRQRRKVGGK